jgi:hypothetical protein
MMNAAFAACDHPVNACQIQGDRTYERLAGKKTDARPNIPKMINSVSHTGVLDRRAEPDVRWDDAVREKVRVLPDEASHTGRTLREDLIRVLVRPEHNLKDRSDERIRHVNVKQVAHTVYED